MIWVDVTPKSKILYLTPKPTFGRYSQSKSWYCLVGSLITNLFVRPKGPLRRPDRPEGHVHQSTINQPTTSRVPRESTSRTRQGRHRKEGRRPPRSEKVLRISYLPRKFRSLRWTRGRQEKTTDGVLSFGRVVVRHHPSWGGEVPSSMFQCGIYPVPRPSPIAKTCVNGCGRLVLVPITR